MEAAALGERLLRDPEIRSELPDGCAERHELFPGHPGMERPMETIGLQPMSNIDARPWRRRLSPAPKEELLWIG